MSGPAPRSLSLGPLLARHGIRLKKSLGQNFLQDEGALAKIADAAELMPGDTVLEIGPGAGSLTRHLAHRARRVVAVELDNALAPVLAETLAGYDNIDLVFGDILEQDMGALLGADAAGYKVVANVPYYITSAILRHLLENAVQPGLLVLTIQREVAQRIVAGPGALSLLAVSVQYFGQAELVGRIGAGAFLPRPKVDSAIIRVRLHDQPLAPDVPVRDFFRVAQAGFGQKRKQLKNALSAGLQRPTDEIVAALESAGIAPSRRAETLSLPEWAELARALGH